MEEVVQHEEGDKLVLLVDEAEALRVARPVRCVDDQPRDDGTTRQYPQQGDWYQQSPEKLIIVKSC